MVTFLSVYKGDINTSFNTYNVLVLLFYLTEEAKVL